MPLGAARISLLAKTQVVAVAEVIREKKDAEAFGNAQIDTAQYKFGGSSAKFDGAGDYIKAYEAYGWGSSQDFTWECWFRQDTNTNTYPVLFCNYEAFGANDWGLFVDRANDNKLSLWVRNINTSAAILESTTNIADDTWYHVAITRSGSNWTMWVNGSSEDTTTSSATIDVDTRKLYIGMAPSTSSSAFNGWIDEFRMSTTARYSSTFTPQTAPHVNDEDTFILLHMDGTDAATIFPDDNGVRTRNDGQGEVTASITTTLSKFGGSSYNSGISSSDRGSGKRVRTGLEPLGTGDFTIECWFQPKEDFGSTGTHLWAHRLSSSGPFPNLLVNANPNTFRLYEFIGGVLSNSDISSSTWSLNNWYHVAAVRNNGTNTLYVNGTSQGSYSSSVDITNELTIGNLGYATVLGAPGAIDEFRVSNTARYTSNFTPQTAPFVNDSNTLLLYHFDGTDGSTYFPDDNGVREKVSFNAIGDTHIDTAQSKFGGSSAYFDKADDKIDVNFSGDVTGVKTVECWLYPTSLASNGIFLGNRNSSTYSGVWYMRLDTDGSVLFSVREGGTEYGVRSAVSTVTLNTWHHVAAVVDGSTVAIYIDGNLESSRTDLPTSYEATMGLTKWYIGARGDLGVDYRGYIDEIRFSDSVRYTANFTPATEPFENDNNTLLLMHMDGTDGSQDFTDDNGADGAYWGP